MKDRLKIRFVGKWQLSLLICLCYTLTTIAQSGQSTKLLRTSKDKDDIEFLDEMYNIENVSMDQVFYVEFRDSLEVKSVPKNSNKATTPQAGGSPFVPSFKPLPVNGGAASNPVDREEEVDSNPPEEVVQIQRAEISRAASSSKSNVSRLKKRKTRVKRVRLPKRRKGKKQRRGCYRF